MKQKITLSISLLLLVTVGNAQDCSSCTETVSTNTTANYTITAGETLCILSGITLNGNITMDGGEVCNDGTHTGNVNLNDGLYTNYGLLNGATNNVNHDRGTFRNEGVINQQNYAAVGADIVFINNGTMSIQDFDLGYMNTGDQPIATNNGTINCNNLVVDSVDFTNNNEIVGSGNLSVLSSGYFANYGPIEIDGNFLTQATGVFYNECTVAVGGNWSNNGTISGPTSGCGSFDVSGFATNQPTGQLAIDDSYIDVCEQSTPGGLFDLGSSGSNVTECSCTGTCSPVSISEWSAGTTSFSVYPNPVAFDESVIIRFEGADQLSWQIISLEGKVLMNGKLNAEARIDLGAKLSSGVYILRVGNLAVQLVVKD